MKRITNFDHCDAKTPQNTGGGNSQQITAQHESARKITARFESAQMKNTSLISGCGALDVTSSSYRASDEHPMSTRSASDGGRWNSRGWKYVACLLLAFFVGIGQMWGAPATPYAITADFEEASPTTYTWAKNSGDAATRTNKYARTGGYSGFHFNKASGDKEVRLTFSSVPKYTSDDKVHAIMWVRKGVSSATSGNKSKIKQLYLSGGSASSSASEQYTFTNNDWHRLSSSGSRSNSNMTSIRVDITTTANSASDTIFYDDFVVYYDANTKIDLKAPNAATNADATSSEISWKNGSDASDDNNAATGRQATLIWKHTSGSSNNLTLNNQGVYAASAKDQSGDWTCVSATVSADATSYEGTFTPGDVYAIVHRDLAYNYSTPTYVTIPGGAPVVDVTPPILSSSTPADGATSVALSGNIVLTMSENVSVLDASKFTLSGGAGSLTTASISASGAAVTIPYSGLANSTTYTLSAAASAVEDAAHNANEAFSISFTTICLAPSIAWGTQPAGGEVGDADAVATVTTTPGEQTITWTSSRTAVATVTNGTIHYVAPGFTNISAGFTYSGSDYCEETVSVNKDIVVPISTDATGTNDKYWYYTSAAPNSPDNGLTYSGKISADNGLFGTKLNSDGYAWFAKPAVAGTLRVGAYYSGSSSDAYVVDVYACSSTGTKGDKIESLTISHIGGVSATLDIDAEVEGIYIARQTNKEGVLYFVEFKDATPSCGVTAPGDITAGDLTNGEITLTAGGDKGENDTWYWQSSASGTDKTGTSGASKTVDAAGTYYIRSYNTEDNCWSEAKSIELTAEDFLATPEVTFNDGVYVVGASALDLSTLFTSQNTSAVSFALKVASEDATVSGSNFTATKEGSYVVTASQVADANYTAVSEEATITVTYPATGEATISYVLDVTNNGTTLQTTKVDKNVSTISASASTTLLAGGLGTGGSNNGDKSTHKGGRTLGINVLPSEDADKYFYVTLSVADGYEFTPSAISLKVLTIGGDDSHPVSYKAVLTDGENSITGTATADSDDELTLGSWDGLGTTTLSGDVTLKLYAWYTTSDTYNAYRLSTPITIVGTVAEYVAPVDYTVTINPNGGAYASTPTGWTYDDVNGVYTKTVTGGTSFSAPEGLEKGTDELSWKDGSENVVTFPTTISGDITFIAQWTPYVPSSDATLSDLTVGGTTVAGFDAATTSYNVELPFGTFAAPTVAGIANDTKAKSVAVTQAATANGDAIIVVTAEDNSTKTYTIHFSVVATKDLLLVFKTGSTACVGTPSTATQILSNNAAVSTYINQITFTNVEGSGDNGKEGGSLDVGKKAGNMFTLSAKAGFAMKSMNFLAKIEDANCEYSLNGGEWTTLTSTDKKNDVCYEVFADAEVHEFRLRSTGNSGVWIRNMQLTMIQACTPKTIAWTAEPASEYEVGKSGYAIAASANNGTVTYAASNAAITVNESTGALTINSLTNDIDLSASVPAGDGTLYCATPASVVKEEIKTYYLVTFDAQNETAATPVKYYSGDAAIALPNPSYPGYVFQGWFDAATGGNQITEAITPSASRTVYAQWEAECAGPTITVQPASAEYKTGRTAAALACTATAGDEGELTYSWYSCDDAERTNPVLLAGAPTPSTAVAGTFYYYCTVQEAECDVVRTSNVAVITVTEKDPVCIIKATPTSGAEATADGAYKGNAYFKGRSTDKKLNSDYDYVGVKLASGYTFVATDKVVLNQTANLSSGDISKFYIFTEVPADGKTYVTVDNPSPVKGDNGFEMPAGLVGESALYIGRVDANCNPTVGYLAVYRVMNPELVSLSVNSVAAAKGVGNAYSVTLPAGTNLASLSLTERIAWNAPAESDSKQVTTNEGAWAWGDNTYVLTDKDGDATAYTITLIEAAAIDHVAISGTLTVMEDASTTLSAIVYDTNDEPASIQDVTWSVKSGDEALAEVSALGVVTGKAVGTAHIIATSVADPTVSAQVEVTVTAFSGCKKAYWFGYAADAATNNVENNSTVFGNAPSNASNNSGKTIKLIEDEWEVSVSKKTGSIGNFGTFTVPAGYNATLYLVTNTGGSREFQLKQNDVVKYTQNASSGDPVITKFEDVAPGTYSVLSTSNCSGFYMMAAELCRVPMTGIALDITSKSMLTIDPVFQLTPTFTPATATDKRISWTTTDEDVVTVADGIVTPVGEGTATITVTTEDGGYTATCEVTVSEINCTSFDGTIYEMAAKEQATRKDIAVSGGEENEVALTVEDVVYTRGAAASLGVKGSSAKTPRITAKSEEALSSIDYNSADVYVKIPLGCNLRPTDVITFTANDDTKELKLGNTAASVGTISTSSLSYTVESGDALEGRNVLYVWRGDNTGFVSVNVTRVPLVTIESVALADLTIRAGKTNKPQLTVNPDNGTILSAVWEITAATGVTGSTIDAATGDVTAGTLDDPEQEGTITVKVTINEDADLSATCTVTVVGNIAQTDVVGSIIWDWHNTGATSNNQLTNKTDPKKNENFVLANVVPGNANFATDKLVVEGEHLTRDYDKATPYFQGQLVSFRFAEATEGVVRITYSHTAGEMTEEKPAREIYINDVATGEIADNATFKASELIPVNASEVTITARNINSTAADDKQYLRIAKIEFYALDKVRDDSWIAPRELGTVCYPNGHIVIGADMYKMAGVNENGKFAFDQVDVTEPGVPYLFEATGYEPIKFYKTTAATAEEAGTSNGMVGTFVQKTLSYLTDENTYYFQGAHFYAVTDRSKDLVVPANRCYVDLNEPHPAAAPKAGVRRIVFGVNGTNITTDLENIEGNAVQSAKVLIDGRMYILRGEKMYDATGRLVK